MQLIKNYLKILFISLVLLFSIWIFQSIFTDFSSFEERSAIPLDPGIQMKLSPVQSVLLLTILLSMPYSFYELVKGLGFKFYYKIGLKLQVNKKRIFYALLLVPLSIALFILNNLVYGLIIILLG